MRILASCWDICRRARSWFSTTRASFRPVSRGRKPSGGAFEFLLTRRVSIDMAGPGTFCETWEGLTRGLGSESAPRTLLLGAGVQIEIIDRRGMGPRAPAGDWPWRILARVAGRDRRNPAAAVHRGGAPPRRRSDGGRRSHPLPDRLRRRAGRRRRADRGPALHAGADGGRARRRPRDRVRHVACGAGDVPAGRGRRSTVSIRWRPSTSGSRGKRRDNRARENAGAARGRRRDDGRPDAGGLGAGARRRGRGGRGGDISSSFRGARFEVVTDLITNFHLPRSTLLMLVAAFAGREPVLAAYAEAVELGYRSTAMATRC